MATFLSARRSVLAIAHLVFSAALLASISEAWAGEITYYLVDYPVNEGDVLGSGTDTVSGTIVTDGTLGPLSTANIIGGTLSLEYPLGTVAGPASFGSPVGLEATATELVLSPGSESSFSISTNPYPATTAQLLYENVPGDGLYCANIDVLTALSAWNRVLFDSTPVSADSGSIGAASSWVIATVPEPTSLAILYSAILVFSVIYLRQRWIRRVYESRKTFRVFPKSGFRALPDGDRISIASVSRRSTARERVKSVNYAPPHRDECLRSGKSCGRKRFIGRTHWSRTLVCEPLEVRTLLSVSLPVGWQAVPIGNYDLVATPDYTGSSVPYGLTPNQIRGAYGLGSYTSGVLSNGMSFGGIKGDGTGQTIAIVDAYDDPTALGDLNTFSTYFGLPTLGGPGKPTFQKLTQAGQPVSSIVGNPNYVSTDPAGPFSSWTQTQIISGDTNWELEESLDIEWAHVVAPMANIILYEAEPTISGYQNGKPIYDYLGLYTAVMTAANTAGVVAVSMSWYGPEFSGTGTNNAVNSELTFDSTYFITATGHTGGSASIGGQGIPGGVTFLAAAGDNGAYPADATTAPPITPEYPASSPNVVAVGGTSLAVSGTSPSYTYAGEIAWGNGTSSWASGGGGGGISGTSGVTPSENEPTYQDGVVSTSITTAQRAYPDVSAVANPSTGVPIYDSYDFTSSDPWSPFAWGGTSLATPIWAGIIAIADEGRAIAGLGSLYGATQTLPLLYQMPVGAIHDITSATVSSLSASGLSSLSAGNTLPGPSVGPSPLYSPAAGYDLATGLGSPVANVLVPDLVAPTVTITVPTTQPNPTSTPTNIEFQVAFSEPVTGFNASSVTLSGAPGEFVSSVTGSGMNYDVYVSATGSGTIVASIPAGAAHDAGGDGNMASTSSHNSVTISLETLYWAGANGTWNSNTANWKNSSGTAEDWQSYSNAVFPSGVMVTLAPGFNPEPASITFQAGNTTLNTGSFSLTPGTSIAVSTGAAATVSSSIDIGVINGGLALSIPSGAVLTLDGDESGIMGVTVASPAGGTLQFGGTQSPNGSKLSQGAIKFPSGGATSHLIFDTSKALDKSEFASYGNVEVWSGAISGNVNFTAQGSQTFGLSGNNSYTGSSTFASNSAIVYASSLVAGSALFVDCPLTVTGASASQSVSAQQPAGAYGVGSEIDIDVPMGENVFVTGSPELELAAGTARYAQYIGGSGTSTLTFCYTVQAGDESVALDYSGSNALVLNGASIVDNAGNPVDPVLPAPGTTGSLSTYEVLLIDTTAPVVSDIACVGPPTAENSTVQWGVTFDKPVNGVTAADFALAGAGVTGTIASVTGGGTTYIVTVNDLSGTGTLRLNLVDDDAIVDDAGNLLGEPGAGNANFTGQAFNIVTSLPWVSTGMNFTGTEGQTSASISGVVATFTDDRDLYSAGDYSAEIDWGDGGTSQGTVTCNATTQQFDVSGSFTYAYAGNWAIQVFISDPTGLMAVSNGMAAIADVPLSATGMSSLAATEGAAFSGTVATFTDPVPLPSPSDYWATIAWGDGQTSMATISFNTATQQYQVAGSHVYSDFGPCAVDVTIHDPGGSSADAVSSMAVADAPLAASGQYVTYTPGTAFSGTVATFTHIGGSVDPGDYTAAITWTTSRGVTTTAGTVTYDAAAQQFAVGGSFTFPDETGDQISVAITDNAGTIATATSTPTTLTVSLAQIAPMVGVAFSGTVASFNDTDPGAANTYSATVTWGDGATSTVTSAASAAGQIVADPNGGFDVVASHTYLAAASAATFSVEINGTGRTIEVSADIAVIVPVLTSVAFTPPVAVEGTPFYHVLLYHFLDSDPNAIASDYTASVGWGDTTGLKNRSAITSTPGAAGQIVADPAGGFDVLGSHEYTSAISNKAFSVDVWRNDLTTVYCEVSQSISVAAAPLTAGALTPPGPVGSTSFADVALFTFTDSYPAESGSVFTATVSWGDGTTSIATEGTPSSAPDYLQETYAGSGVWVVYGSHNYQYAFDGGTFSVEVNDTGGASTGASASDFTIADAAPVATSLDCVGSTLAVGAGSLQFAVNFNENVTGVAAGDFTVAGQSATATVAGVAGAGSTYIVTVDNVSGNGLLGLDLVDDESIVDAFGTPLGGFVAGNGNFTGQEYALSSALYWNADGSAGGGSGLWSGGAFWAVGSQSGPLTDWIDGADAFFPAGTGTVTIVGQVAANSLDFQGAGAIVQGSTSSGSLSLVPDAQSPIACGISVSSGVATVAVSVAGGGFAETGAGTLVLSGANTFTGTLDIAGGTLNFSSLGNLGSGGITFDGGTLQYSSNFSGSTDISAFPVAIDARGATIDTNGNYVTFANPIGNYGGGGLTVIDSRGGGTLVLAGANNYSGVTTIGQGGTLNITSLSSLGNLDSGGITFDGGTLQYSSNFSGSTDISAFPVTIDANGAAIDLNGNYVTFANAIGNGGKGGLTVLDGSGGGTLALDGANSYGGAPSVGSQFALGSGGLTVDGGTLDLGGVSISVSSLGGSGGLITNSNPYFTSTLTVDQAVQTAYYGTIQDGAGFVGLAISAGGSLTLAGTASLSGDVTVAAGGELDIDGTLTLGNFSYSYDAGAVSINGALNLENGATLFVNLGGAVNDRNALTIAAGSLLYSDDGTLNVANGSSLNVINGGTLYNDGTMNLDGTMSVVGSALVVYEGVLIVENYAGLTIDGGTLEIFGGLGVDNHASLTLDNGGSLTIDASSGLTVDNDSLLTIGNGSSLTVTYYGVSSSLNICDDSTLTVQSGGALNVSGMMPPDSASTLTVDATSALDIAGTLNNSGLMTISGTLNIQASGWLSNSGVLNVTNSGTLNITNSGMLTTQNSASLSNSGTLNITNCGMLTVQMNGSLGNNGTLNITNSGTLQIDAWGTLTNYGYLTIDSSSLLDNYGTLDNEGQLTNNGTLTLESGSQWINNGTLIEGTSQTPTGPTSPQSANAAALDFDGSTNYIDLGQTLAFTKTSPFSVSFWMCSANTNQQMIIGKGDGFLDHGAPGWTVFTAWGYLYFQLNAATSFGVSEMQAWDLNTPVCNGQWHHIVVTYDGSQSAGGVEFYIDGAAQPLGTDSNDLTTGDITNYVDATIGATADGQGFYCGALAEMDVFNRAITSADVATLYAGGAGDYGAQGVAGLIAGFHLGDATSSAITDYSGNETNGVLYGNLLVSAGPVSLSTGSADAFDSSLAANGIAAIGSGVDALASSASQAIDQTLVSASSWYSQGDGSPEDQSLLSPAANKQQDFSSGSIVDNTILKFLQNADVSHGNTLAADGGTQIADGNGSQITPAALNAFLASGGNNIVS